MKLVAIFAVSALMLLGAVVGLLSIALSWGEPTLYRGFHHSSPDGKIVATFFAVGQGGATGSVYTRISVRHAEDEFDPEVRQFSARRMYQVCLEWESNSRLLVKYPMDVLPLEARRIASLSDGEVVELVYLPQPAASGELQSTDCGGKIGDVEDVYRNWE